MKHNISVAIILALLLSLLACSRRPTESYPPARPALGTAPLIARGQEVLGSLQANKSTNGIATVDFKSKGVQLSLVIFPEAWSALSATDQDALAAFVEHKASGRLWRIFEGGQVVRHGQ